MLDDLLKYGLLVDKTVRIAGDTTLEAPVLLHAHGSVKNTFVGAYSYMSSGCSVTNARIGRYCSIGHAVEINPSSHPVDWLSTSPFPYINVFAFGKYTLDESFDDYPRPVTIGNDVWVGARAGIMGGVTVGNGAIIGFGSVVTKDVPPYAIVGGAPATVRRMRFDDALIARLEAFQWWRLDVVNKGIEIDWRSPHRALDQIEAAEARGELHEIKDRLRRMATENK